MLFKAVGYATTLSASGGIFFLLYTDDLLEGDARRAIRRLLMLMLVGSVAAEGCRIAIAGASMSGGMDGLLDVGLARMFLQAGEWQPALSRLIGVSLMAGWLWMHRGGAWLAILAAAAGATSFAWSGHVQALATQFPAAQRWVPSAIVAVHLLSAAFWVGALGPLLIVAQRSTLSVAVAATARFGGMARFAVGALLLAGTSLAALLLQHPQELWSDPYGRRLLTKVALVVGLLALAAVNRWRLTPRLIAYDAGALRLLTLSLQIELALVVAILGVTAALTTLAGPPGLDVS